jgi:hypothetical protein
MRSCLPQVRVWLRSLSGAELRLRLRAGLGQADARRVFALLQGIQVARPQGMGPAACRLRWSDAHLPEPAPAPASALHDPGPDLFRLRAAEATLFSRLFAQWDEAGGQASFSLMATSAELTDILSVLSGGQCFSMKPASYDNVYSLMWLQGMPYFTLGQLVAGCVEVGLWRAYGLREERAAALEPASPASRSIEHLLRHAATAGTDTDTDTGVGAVSGRVCMMAVLQREAQLALSDLLTGGDELLSFFASILRPRVKRATDGPGVAFVSGGGRQAPPLRALWAACCAAQSWGLSFHTLHRNMQMEEEVCTCVHMYICISVYVCDWCVYMCVYMHMFVIGVCCMAYTEIRSFE